MVLKQHIFFVGIGGAGMSGIAKVLLELGNTVSGSDLLESETTKRLENLGAIIYTGHREENLASSVETVVVSSAIPQSNPEVVKAKSLGIPVIQRAEMLGMLMRKQKGIAVAGSHGKTTTTSMISLMLEKNNYDPTVVVGGELNDIGGNAKLGAGQYLVAEADESDGSFLKLHPFISVVTNIEDDHLDYYGTLANIENAFRQFILNTSEEGYTVLCLEDLTVSRLLPSICEQRKLITYGFSPEADFWARDLQLCGLESRATVLRNNKVLGELRLNVPGRHNFLNALAALAVGTVCGMGFAEIAAGLAAFNGVQRRFQKVGQARGVEIYDDYAHHPTELRATLAAAKTLKPKRVVAVFQPHRYSRTNLLAREFGAAFQDADLLIINEIYAAGEKPINGVSALTIVEEIRKNTDQRVEYIPEKSGIVCRLTEEIQPGDLVITLGAGNIYTVAYELAKGITTKEQE